MSDVEEEHGGISPIPPPLPESDPPPTTHHQSTVVFLPKPTVVRKSASPSSASSSSDSEGEGEKCVQTAVCNIVLTNTTTAVAADTETELQFAQKVKESSPEVRIDLPSDAPTKEQLLDQSMEKMRLEHKEKSSSPPERVHSSSGIHVPVHEAIASIRDELEPHKIVDDETDVTIELQERTEPSALEQEGGEDTAAMAPPVVVSEPEVSLKYDEPPIDATPTPVVRSFQKEEKEHPSVEKVETIAVAVPESPKKKAPAPVPPIRHVDVKKATPPPEKHDEVNIYKADVKPAGNTSAVEQKTDAPPSASAEGETSEKKAGDKPTTHKKRKCIIL